MIQTVDAERFFPNGRPAFLPQDAVSPDYKTLLARTQGLSPDGYPVAELADILQREHVRLGAHSRTMARIAGMREECIVVVCGQQAGLFGGPLYTLYKAMHTVRLAERLSHDTGRTVTPVFWIASDDHDFGEVSSLGLKTPDGSTARVDYRPVGYREGMPVGDIVLDEGVSDAVETLARHLSPGGDGDAYGTLIRETWLPGRSWADAFASQMLRMFDDAGLVFVDPRWNGIKALFSPVMAAEILDPQASTALINEGADEFESARLRKRALRKPEHATNLFLDMDGIRQAVFFEDGAFHAGGMSFSGGELAGLLEREPGRFSPAAGIRPVCQDALMPVAAMIAGPGERLYLSQVARLYSHFGVDGSLVWPRAGFTVLEPRVVRIAGKENIAAERLFDDPGHLRTMLAESSLPKGFTAVMDNLRRSVEEGFAAVEREIAAIDPTLGGAAAKERGRVLHTLDGVSTRAVKAHKASQDVSRRRLAIASYLLHPEGVPQERWFGTDAILPLIGRGGFAQFCSLTSPGEERHRIVLFD